MYRFSADLVAFAVCQIIKQLVFLHKSAKISPEEAQAYVRVLHGNVLTSITTLLQEAQNFGLNFSEHGEDIQHASELVESADSRQPLTLELVEAIELLWFCAPIQSTYDKRDQFWLLECAPYYLTHMRRFIEEDYQPTEEDIVMARKRTTGVVETQLKFRNVKWSVVDVGGQRSERRKWLNCFDGAKGMLFTVNLSGYASVLFEDRRENRMVESLRLFEETVANPVFANVPIFLVLNKKDLFEQLIETKPLTLAFPEYTGPQRLRPCIEYISQQFAARMPADRPKPLVLLMAARVKKDVQWCFEDIYEVILDANRKHVQSAQDKLARLREKYRNEQIEEMEKRASENKRNRGSSIGETSLKRDSVLTEKSKSKGAAATGTARNASKDFPPASPLVAPAASAASPAPMPESAVLVGAGAAISAEADTGNSGAAFIPPPMSDEEYAKMMEEMQMPTQHWAATKVQAVVRGRQTRKELAEAGKLPASQSSAKPAAKGDAPAAPSSAGAATS
jgi:GTPase SAR1 family protein